MLTALKSFTGFDSDFLFYDKNDYRFNKRKEFYIFAYLFSIVT
jgi:hypothetical protein